MASKYLLTTHVSAQAQSAQVWRPSNCRLNIPGTDLLGVLDPLETILQLHTSSGGGDAAHSQHSTLSLLTGHTSALLDGRLPTAHVTGAAA